MKRTLTTILTLALLLSLASCGTSAPQPTAAATAPPSEGREDVATAAPTAWESAGRAYKQEALDIEADSVISVFAHGGEYYHAIMRFGENGRETYEIVGSDGGSVYSPENASIACAAGGDAGIWTVETLRTEQGSTRRLRLGSYSGEELATITLSSRGLGEYRFYALRCEGERVFLRSSELVALVDGDGKLLTTVPVDSAAVLLSGGDGRVYLAEDGGKETTVSLVDETGLTALMTLPVAGAGFYGGNAEFPLTCVLDDGLYGVDTEGTVTPIIIWRDCGISASNIRGLVPLTDGEFLLLTASGSSLLTPVDTSEMKSVVTLVAASVGGNLYGRENDFNALGSGVYVEIKDYTEGGKISTQDALSRLGSDIISGHSPDLLLLENMPVYTYINKGYLAELGSFMDADPELSREDITIEKQLNISDGIYLIGDRFSIDTRVGLYSVFGDAYGWTLERYLELESALPADGEMIYNNTRPDFFRVLCSRYIQKAMDWQTGACDFDNEEFIALLEAVAGIRETPEPADPTQVNFTPHETRLRDGTLCVAAYRIGTVTSLESYEKRLGERVSAVGMPTPDGSCGSELMLSNPIGIFSAGEHQDECWEFIKFLLTGYDAEEMMAYSGLPAYKPHLERQLEIAQSTLDESGEPTLSKAGAERFLETLDNMGHVAVYDETALEIIEEEARSFFAGDKSAKACAEAVQSRVSIYMAEQR